MGTTHVLHTDFIFGKTGAGRSLKYWGDTAGVYMLWDSDALTLVGADFATDGLITIANILQINDNYALQFEGIGDDSDGLKVSCDSSGDATIEVTAGKLTINTSDNSILMTGETLSVDEIEVGAGSGLKKLSFFDTDVFLRSPNDGKLEISANASGSDDISMYGTVTIADAVTIGDVVSIGAGGNKKLSFYDTDTFIISSGAGKLIISANAAGADDVGIFGTLSLEDSMQIAASTYITCLGTGATGLIMKNLKNAATSALSGTAKDVEIDIGGAAHYFPVYPTKA